jgi:predicted acetyltransferase
MKNKDKIRLILPSLEMKNRAMAFRDAFLTAGENRIYGSCGMHHFDDFNEWLIHIKKTAEGKADFFPEGLALFPAVTYFAIRTHDSAIVGAANIRYYIDEPHYHNGHIGYSVHPQERGKGYGKEILRLALIKTVELGIIEPVVSCNKDNRASKKIIERNGLEFEKQYIENDGSVVLVYRYLR